jgi:hypothetical protein
LTVGVLLSIVALKVDREEMVATLLVAVLAAVAVPGVFRLAAQLDKSTSFKNVLQRIHLL